MQGARSAETGMYMEYMRISSTAQRPAGSALRGASPPGDGVRRRTPFAAIFRPISASHPFFLNHPFASAFDHQQRLVRGSLQVIRTVTLTETHNRVSAIA